MTFEEAHESGSKEFLGLWLRANERAIEVAQECGLTVHTNKNKKLLSLVVLFVLREAKKDSCICKIGSVFVNPKCTAKEHRP